MKLHGFVGKGTGKLGSSVFAISGGEQIVRQYNPNVSNPSTDAQVAQRAKFKLISQIAADLARVIAIPKQGLKSSRNLFVSKNIGLSEFNGDTATIDALKLQLTPSDSPISQVQTTSSQDGISVNLRGASGDKLDAVVYIVVQTDDVNQMVVEATRTVTEAGGAGTFPTTFDRVSGNGVVYAYGIKKGTLDENASYENYSVEDGYDAAFLVTNRTIKNASAALTGTTGVAWSLE